METFAAPNWNVVAICDTAGSVKERFNYDAFGKRNATEFDWNRAFTGQVLDAETGLMLYRERYYSNDLGRFISRDPIEYGGMDNNLYRYVHNSSTNYVDLFGLASWWSDFWNWLYSTGSYASPPGVGEAVGALDVVGTAMQADNIENYFRARRDREIEGTPNYNYWQGRLDRCRQMRNHH